MGRVFVNGYGSIGRRVAAFLQDDPQMDVIGVGKYTPGEAINDAISRGLEVYVPPDRQDRFGPQCSGTIPEALQKADIIVDASPGGSGYRNKRTTYDTLNIPIIYQGGESTFGPEAVSDFIFNSRVNYAEAVGRSDAVQGSCNVTGMGRIIEPLQEEYGTEMARIDITLVRRWADIEQTSKIVPDSIEMSPDPHHAGDAKRYLGEHIPLYVRAVKVPTRQMHLHIMDVRFSGAAPKPDAIHQIYKDEGGVAVLDTATSTREVRQYAESMQFHFKDTNMVHIHAAMTASRGDTLQIMYSDDQTGIVIPENHMLMQAMLYGRPYRDAITHTESVFHMSERKAQLEGHFAA